MGRGGAAFFLRCVLSVAQAHGCSVARASCLLKADCARLPLSLDSLRALHSPGVRLPPIMSALASARSTVSWGAGADWRLLRFSRFLSGQLDGRAGVAARGALRRASQFHKAPAAARARRES